MIPSRRSQFGVLLLLFGIILLLSLGLGCLSPVAADTVTSTPTADDIAAQAQAALSQANALSNQAAGVLTQASAVSSQAGLVLNFIQVVAIVGGLAGALGGYFFAVRGLRTLNAYQTDLEAARGQLDVMRKQLDDATSQALQARRAIEAESTRQLQQVQTQAAAAYRAFSLIQIGEQQFAIGNIQAAQQMYQEAYELNPDSHISNYLLGELYVITRDLDKAVEFLERALHLAANLPPTYAALGLARRLQGDKKNDPIERNQLYARAEQLLLKAIELNPGVRDAHKESAYSTLGGLYRRQSRIDEAVTAYTTAESITPNNSYPVVNLAQLHFIRGDVEQAQTYFRRALAISQRTLENNPSDPWARLDIITAELALGETDEALKQLAITLKQKQPIGLLETLLDGLNLLKKAPHPPTKVDEAVAQVEATIQQIKGT